MPAKLKLQALGLWHVRPNTKAVVRGIPAEYEGAWYIYEVLHTINSTGYRMEVTLVRNYLRPKRGLDAAEWLSFEEAAKREEARRKDELFAVIELQYNKLLRRQYYDLSTEVAKGIENPRRPDIDPRIEPMANFFFDFNDDPTGKYQLLPDGFLYPIQFQTRKGRHAYYARFYTKDGQGWDGQADSLKRTADGQLLYHVITGESSELTRLGRLIKESDERLQSGSWEQQK